MMLNVSPACPACTCKSFKKVSLFDFEHEKTSFFPVTYNILECDNCGLWFKENIPPNETIAAYYASLSLTNDMWGYEKRLPHERKIDKILNQLKDGKRVLDVGCWTGRLLSQHVRLNRFGIEPNSESAAVAFKNGITIVGKQVSEEVLRDHTYSVITLIDVFEHLANPTEVIETLLRRLEPKGKLIIVTAATDSLPVKLAGITYWYFSRIPDHIVFLNKQFVEWLGKKNIQFEFKSSRTAHYNSNFFNSLKELTWLFIWRYLNPNAPFKKGLFFRLFSLKRFANLKEIIICRNMKDHLFIEITRK